MPPWAPLATHLGESIFDLVKGARVCRAQPLLEGFLDDIRDGCPPQLLGVREPHVDGCQVAAEPWPVLLELVEDRVVGQHDSERCQALVQVVEVIDEGTHLVIPNSIPTRPSGPPCSAGREGCESGRRCLNDEGPVDGREHVRSMMLGLREGKGLRARPHIAVGTPSDLRVNAVMLSDFCPPAASSVLRERPPPDDTRRATEQQRKVGGGNRE